MTSLARIIRSLRSMPPLPDVATRVLAIVRAPDYTIEQLVGVVRTDPVLTARILKVCNSSVFSLASPIRSVADAVAYLGARNLVQVVLVSCTASYFKNLPANPYADATELWRQTTACATACQLLAERTGFTSPASAFTVGILHNLGRVAMVQVVDAATLERAGQRLRDPAAAPLAVEHELLGLDHAAANGVVTESWGLPAELRHAARHHHDPAHIAADCELTALLHTADELVMGMGIGDPCPARTHHPLPAALHRLRLPVAELDDVRHDIATALEQAAELLNPEATAGR